MLKFFGAGAWGQEAPPHATSIMLPVGSSDPISVGAEAKSILIVEAGGRNLYSGYLKNVGDNPLTSAIVKQRRHPLIEVPVPYVGESDWADALNNPNIAWVCNDDGFGLPNQLAAGEVADFGLWIPGIHIIELIVASTLGTEIVALGNATLA
jgi:hypothetical protein